MGARENECQIAQNDILHMNFSEFYRCVFTILVKFDIYFLGFPREIVFAVITDNKLFL